MTLCSRDPGCRSQYTSRMGNGHTLAKAEARSTNLEAMGDCWVCAVFEKSEEIERVLGLFGENHYLLRARQTLRVGLPSCQTLFFAVLYVGTMSTPSVISCRRCRCHVAFQALLLYQTPCHDVSDDPKKFKLQSYFVTRPHKAPVTHRSRFLPLPARWLRLSPDYHLVMVDMSPPFP